MTDHDCSHPLVDTVRDGALEKRRMMTVSAAALAALLVLAACQRDSGREVEPMADPLRSGNTQPAATAESIPLEKVRKSQAAAVSQRVADTEITITYSRPVACG